MENLFLSKVRVSVSSHWEYYHKRVKISFSGPDKTLSKYREKPMTCNDGIIQQDKSSARSHISVWIHYTVN